MNKKVISLSLAAALSLSLAVIPASAATTGDVDEAVAVLSTLGIVGGYDDGLYHPEDLLTRTQFCKLAILAEGHGDLISGSAYRSLFSDVPGSHWAAPYVNLAYEEGLMNGKGDGTFGPDEALTVDQAVTVCLRLLGYEQSEIGPFWPEDYLAKARKVGLLDGVAVQDGQALNRGQAALILYNLLQLPNSKGKTFGLALGTTAIENVFLLDTDAEAEDGTLHTAQVYANGSLTWYQQSNTLSSSLTHRRGTLLLDKTGKVEGFLADDSIYKVVAAEEVTASSVKDPNGNSYTISTSTPVILDDEKTTYAACWYELEDRELTLYYAENGGINLVAASDAQKYEGTLLTGYYENAVPNSTAPSTVTLLGHSFDVADDAVGLSGLNVGEKITVSLNGAGEIVRAWSASEKKTTVVAVLDSANRGTLTHISGLSLSATITNATNAAKLEGCLVRVNASDLGECSVSALSGNTSQKLDVKNRKLGTQPISSSVKVYDQVGSAPVVEIEWEDILTDTVAADQITYVGTNELGEVDLLLLDDVTGDGYTYGLYKPSTVSSGQKGGDNYSEWKTIAVKNGDGTTAQCASTQSFRKDSFGGLAVSTEDKVAGVESLTKVANVARSAFDGEDYVVLDGVRVPISDKVQCYNSDSESWIDLATAKGYSDTMTVYYSGKLGGNAKARVIVV